MELRNKKTGEIVPASNIAVGTGKDGKWYDSLAELNKEWEDYEEDELFYVISAEHKSGYECVLKEEYPEICKVAKELGIGFETEKEAMKAVEKLKAWKRLKDSGFKPVVCKQDQYLYFEACWGDNYGGKMSDLDLLFGGEE